LEYRPFLDELDAMDDLVIDAVLNSAIKIQKMTWAQLYQTSSATEKRGVNYELINGQLTADGKPIHSIRISEKIRARVVREGALMKFLSIHPDHDGAYKALGGEDLAAEGVTPLKKLG
jgi:hypothetical protein